MKSLCSLKAEAHLTLEFKKHYVIEPAIWQPGTNVRTYRVDKKKSVVKKLKKVLNIILSITKIF